MSRSIVGAAVLAAAVVVVAGCGVPEDGSPRELSAADLAPPTPEAEPTPTPQTTETARTEALIHLLDENGILTPVSREVPSPLEPGDVVASLVLGPTESESQDLNLSSAIPPTEIVLSTTLIDRTLLVNLGPEGLFQLEGDEQKRAIAQLVFTVTELDSVDDVLLQIEDEFRPLPTDEADTTELQPVDRSDYRSLDPEFAVTEEPPAEEPGAEEPGAEEPTG